MKTHNFQFGLRTPVALCVASGIAFGIVCDGLSWNCVWLATGLVLFVAVRRFGFVAVLAILSFIAMASTLLAPHVQAARKSARRTRCSNHLFQHSGSHPGITVHLDPAFHIQKTSGCRLCSRRDRTLSYVIDDAGMSTRIDLMDVPPNVIWRAVRIVGAD